MAYITLTVDLLRHGEAAGGAVYRGAADDVLTDLGWRQMDEALQLPEAMSSPWTQVICSPKLRCSKFARRFAASHSVPLREYDDLREMDFGDWEGRRFDEVAASESSKVQYFWQDPINNTPPNGESVSALYQRVTDIWQELIQTDKEEHLLLVVHGGVIRAILCHVLSMPLQAILRIGVPHACLTQIRAYLGDGEIWYQLVFHHGSYLNVSASLSLVGGESHQ